MESLDKLLDCTNSRDGKGGTVEFHMRQGRLIACGTAVLGLKLKLNRLLQPGSDNKRAPLQKITCLCSIWEAN